MVAALDLVGLDAEPLAGVAAHPGGGKHAVVAAEECVVGVSGHASSGHGSCNAFEASFRSLRLASAASAGGTSW
jgi:hypothetical protein